MLDEPLAAMGAKEGDDPRPRPRPQGEGHSMIVVAQLRARTRGLRPRQPAPARADHPRSPVLGDVRRGADGARRTEYRAQRRARIVRARRLIAEALERLEKEGLVKRARIEIIIIPSDCSQVAAARRLTWSPRSPRARGGLHRRRPRTSPHEPPRRPAAAAGARGRGRRLAARDARAPRPPRPRPFPGGAAAIAGGAGGRPAPLARRVGDVVRTSARRGIARRPT